MYAVLVMIICSVIIILGDLSAGLVSKLEIYIIALQYSSITALSPHSNKVLDLNPAWSLCDLLQQSKDIHILSDESTISVSTESE